MSVYKEILPSDIKTARSFLSQLVDVLQEDISGSTSRRKYQHFVTGASYGPGVTSSLYQTVYDQDFTLQTANPVFDMTVGLFSGGPVVITSQTGTDSAGKEMFPSSSMMMREKMDNYRQFAASLLGDSAAQFTAPFSSISSSDNIDVALFIAFKRLFARDQMKRETFAMRFFSSASINSATDNLYVGSTYGPKVYTDIGSAMNKLTTFGGQIGNVVDASDTTSAVGLMFYDRGVLVLDLEKVTSSSQHVAGRIGAISPIGSLQIGTNGTQTPDAKLVPDFVVSGSIDDIVDHIATSRFGTSGPSTAFTFQNVTNINSTLIFCRASADEFNYSSNPTYTDVDNRIQVIDIGQEDVQSSFTFITSIGLYDSNDNLLAVAKVSRPIEKSSERDLTLRLRLDFASKRSITVTKRICTD